MISVCAVAVAVVVIIVVIVTDVAPVVMVVGVLMLVVVMTVGAMLFMTVMVMVVTVVGATMLHLVHPFSLLPAEIDSVHPAARPRSQVRPDLALDAADAVSEHVGAVRLPTTTAAGTGAVHRLSYADGVLDAVAERVRGASDNPEGVRGPGLGDVLGLVVVVAHGDILGAGTVNSNADRHGYEQAEEDANARSELYS